MPDIGEPVLLTGCCGYIGAWIALGLLRAGFRVRGTSMEPAHAGALYDEIFAGVAGGEALRGRFELVRAELLDQGSWKGLAEGCSVVVHTAFPVLTDGGASPAAVVELARVGTENVLREAARAGTVTRYVHMSSTVTLLDHHRRPGRRAGTEILGPEDWNTTSTLETDAYARAKVEGERRARALVAELLPRAGFAAVLPGPVIGPPLAGDRLPASVDKTLGPLLSGQLRMGSVELYLGLVDVRDVAAAFVATVGLDPARLKDLGEAARFICVGRPVASLQDIADAIRARAPAYAPLLPRRRLPLPRWLLLAAMRPTLSREAFSYTRANLGRRVDYDTSLTEEILGLRWRSLVESVGDTVDWMRARGHHPPPRRS